MRTVTVPAIAGFTFQGRAVEAGEWLTLTPLEAATLARQRRVSLTRGYQTRQIVPATNPAPLPDPIPEPDPTQRRRRSRRRDLAAESA